MSEPAIVALTPRGEELGQRIAAALGGEVCSGAGRTRELLGERFAAGRPLVCVMSLGIVVRTLGPLTRDKHAEPAVVVVDEAGRFAVSVLGGHAAGANALAAQVAVAIGAQAVITTASEALGLPAVDSIGRDWGWRIEGRSHLTAVAAAVVRGEAVGVFQEAGRRDWWRAAGEWPAHFHRLDALPASGGRQPPDDWHGQPTACAHQGADTPRSPDRFAALLVISDRAVPDLPCPAVVYRPPSLVLGVGCKRGTRVGAIATMFHDICRTHGFAPASLGLIATVSLKADEPGLIAFAQWQGVPLRAYAVEELAAVGPVPTPSETVRRKVGLLGVAEPAAMRAAGTSELLLTKVKGDGITMAVARRDGV